MGTVRYEVFNEDTKEILIINRHTLELKQIKETELSEYVIGVSPEWVEYTVENLHVLLRKRDEIIDDTTITSHQIALVRTLWELAQGRIDALYSEKGAEEEKQAIETWMKRVFPNECDEFIRASALIKPTERD